MEEEADLEAFWAAEGGGLMRCELACFAGKPGIFICPFVRFDDDFLKSQLTCLFLFSLASGLRFDEAMLQTCAVYTGFLSFQVFDSFMLFGFRQGKLEAQSFL